MNQLKPATRARQWFVELILLRQTLVLKALAQQPKLRHREAMARWQWCAVERVIDEGNPDAQSWVGTRRVRLRSLRRALSST